jgi:hypothetical protein
MPSYYPRGSARGITTPPRKVSPPPKFPQNLHGNEVVALQKPTVIGVEETSPNRRIEQQEGDDTTIDDGTSLQRTYVAVSKNTTSRRRPPPPAGTSSTSLRSVQEQAQTDVVNADSSLIFENLALYEEKERKEMEWMVRTTSRFLWCNNNPSTYANHPRSRRHHRLLTPAQCRRAHLLMQAWARRGATRPDSSKAPQVMERILQ